MGKFSKMKKRLLAAALAAVLVTALLPGAALADSSLAIDRDATGTLKIDLKYDGNSLAGGEFDIYYVAELDAAAVLSYTLTGGFQEAATTGGLDINAVKTASEVEEAAQTLAQYTAGVTPTATLTTTGDASDPVSASGLELGVYLAIQTDAPTHYTMANPFLVYIPMMDEEGGGWAGYTPGSESDYGVYTYTAYPKTSYSSNGGSKVKVQVVKAWDDGGFEDERPDSVTAGLYKDGVLDDTQTLSEENNWKYVWTGLSKSYTWTVDEIDVPENYTCTVGHNGRSWTLTNTRGGEDVPLTTALTVTKAWEGDDPETRPDGVSVVLLCDGEACDTVELTADNGWTYTWTGLEKGRTWSAAESAVPEGYISTVESVDGGVLITNTYKNEITEIETVEEEGPGAPQTGLIQWPIPVLLGAGILLIAIGLVIGHRKEKYGKQGR